MATPILAAAPQDAGFDFAASGRRVIAIEAQGLEAVAARIDGAFTDACRAILACRGRVVCTGMGKSGHVARKIAATLASTGTPSFFVHPGEAGARRPRHDHRCRHRARAVLLRRKRRAADVLPGLKRQDNLLIAMTGRPGSSLAREADVHLDASVPAEACPLALAPTASTTAALALGDALAVALLEARGFTAEDFARSHPAGALGRRLLLHIRDVMHAGDDVPRVRETATLSETLVEMSRKRLGMSAVVDADGRLLGLYTDGDLRRTLDDARIDLRCDADRIGDDAFAESHRRRCARRRSRATDGRTQDQRAARRGRRAPRRRRAEHPRSLPRPGRLT